MSGITIRLCLYINYKAISWAILTIIFGCLRMIVHVILGYSIMSWIFEAGPVELGHVQFILNREYKDKKSKNIIVDKFGGETESHAN